MRDELRAELRRVQSELAITTVLVTHDPEEAELLADQTIILERGRVSSRSVRTAGVRKVAVD